MNIQQDSTSCDGSMPIPTFAHDIDLEGYVVSPTRDTFYTAHSPAGDKVLEGNRTLQDQFASYRRPSSSTSTSTSVSTDSSPTATASTIESSSTPGTSPDTPASSNSYTYPSISWMAMQASQETNSELRAPSTPLYKRPRNLKNLAVNTSSAFPLARAVSSASFPMETPNSPASSSSLSFSKAFSLPPPPPRRRLDGPGLTIQTPASDSFQHPQGVSRLPPKPLLLRPETLRHFQSSPSLPLHSTFSAADGEVRLPKLDHSEQRFSPQYDRKQSAPYEVAEFVEKNPAAYPDGPICIYDPHVDLYSEPSAEEASRYDVILNVASEVRNPFQSQDAPRVVPIDLKAAVLALAEPPSSPTTPTAGSHRAGASKTTPRPHPEYIHVPWEHNTDIVPGTASIPPLYDIVKLIDSRVNAGRRVLIHCQCGVSRSASLTVAYGLYKDPSITLQEAYDAVKQKSEWIGPNMNLIMQLQEFRNILHGSHRPNFHEQRLQKSSGSNVLHGRGISTRLGDEPSGSIPQTAPLPRNEFQTVFPLVNAAGAGDLTYGPSSAPSDLDWPSNHRTETTARAIPTPPDGPIVYTNGQVLRNVLDGAHDQSMGGNEGRSPTMIANDPGSSRKAGPQSIGIPLASFIQRSPESSRSSFATAPVRANEDNETFGMTSPRPVELTSAPVFAIPQVSSAESSSTETAPLPQTDAFAAAQQTPPLLVPLHPPVGMSLENSEARAELRSQLGFYSTRSNNNMVAEYSQLRSGSDDRIPNVKSVAPPGLSVAHAQAPLEDVLMSPRATVFTSNPFDQMLDNEVARESTDATTSTKGDAVTVLTDSRSPPLKCGNPIIRSIMDAL